MIQDGADTLTLSGPNNTYSGPTTIDTGTVAAGSTTGLSHNSVITVDQGATLDLAGNDSRIASLAGSGTVTTSTGPATLAVGSDGGDSQFDGVLQDGSPDAPLALTKAGIGTFTLTGTASNYSGGTDIEAGTLKVASATALGNTNGSLTVNGGGLDLNDQSITVGAFNGDGTVDNTGAGTANLTVGSGDADGVFSGVIQNRGGCLSLTKIGEGTQIISGTGDYSGTTDVEQGTLIAGAAGALGGGPAVVNGTLDLAGHDAYFTFLAGGSGGFVQSSGGPATLVIDGSDDTTFSGTLQDGTAPYSQLALDMAGSGTFTLAGPNTFTGPTTVESGVLNITGSFASPITLSGGQVTGIVTTTTALVSSPNSPLAGQTITFTATVTPTATGQGTPAGSVDFYDDTADVDLGTATLDNNGEATFNTSDLACGEHLITATYIGQSLFADSASDPLDQIVGIATTTVLDSSAPSSLFGQAITLTATVTPTLTGNGTPTGSVDFFDETTGVDLGDGTVANGTNNSLIATLSNPSLDCEDHVIMASYSGDGNFVPSDYEIDLTVNQATASIAVTTPTPSPVFGQPVHITAAVSMQSPANGVPTGSVDFYDETTDTDLGTVDLDANGVATLTASGLALGNHTIDISYSGDDNVESQESSTPLNVVGEPLAIQGLGVTPYVEQGNVATLSGSVPNIDGAAFTLSVNWGDGADPESFQYAAGTSIFSVNHYYPQDSEPSYSIHADALSSDGRTADADTQTNVVSLPPSVVIDGLPAGSLDTTTYTLTPVVWDPRQVITGYTWWASSQDPVSRQEGTGATFNFQAIAGVTYEVGLTALEGGMQIARTAVMAGDPGCQWTPDTPTLSVAEKDPGGMVLDGSPAAFDIHLVAGANGVTGPVTVFYNTVDGSGQAANDYQSSDGPQELVFKPIQPLQPGQSMDQTIYVQTMGGFNDGTDKTFSLEISDQNDPDADPSWDEPEVVDGSATATIVRPEVQISSPGEQAGVVDLPDDGSLVEVDLTGEIDPAYANLHSGTAFELPCVAGVEFYTSSGGGTAISPVGGDVIDASLASGNYSGTLYAAVAPATSPLGLDATILGRIGPDQNAVQVVTPWTSVGTWTAGQPADVRANVNGASLADLATDITGVAADASAMSSVGFITQGRYIDVTPLLQILETRIRQNVVAAALVQNKNAVMSNDPRSFGEAGAATEQQIIQVFKGGGQPVVGNCASMVALEMSYGLITQLNPGEFTSLGLKPQDFFINTFGLAPSPDMTLRTVPLSGLKPGDWARFWNTKQSVLDTDGARYACTRYPYSVHGTGWMWASENVIDVSSDPYNPNTTKYYGWSSAPEKLTYTGWLQSLRSQWNEALDPGSPDWMGPTDEVGYIKDTAGFINVPKVAQMIFNLRSKPKT